MSWIPLGPRDVYVPSKNVSPRYLRNVNISNTAITNNAYITNVARNRVRDIRFANRDVPGAVTTVPRTAFITPRTGPKPVWTGDFRDNARLQRGPERPRPWPDQEQQRYLARSAIASPGQRSTCAPPMALAPVNTDRSNGDGRMTVPRTPTDRRQIQSDGNWKRIDARPSVSSCGPHPSDLPSSRAASETAQSDQDTDTTPGDSGRTKPLGQP